MRAFRWIDTSAYADRDRQRAALLQLFLLVNAATMALALLATPLTDSPAIAAGVVLVGLVQVGLSIRWVRIGKLSRAGLYYSVSGWTALATLSWFTGGLASPLQLGMPVVIVIVGFVVGTKIALGVGGMTIAHVVVQAVSQTTGGLPTQIARPGVAELCIAMIYMLMMVALLVVLATTDTQRTIERGVSLLSACERAEAAQRETADQLRDIQRIAGVGAWYQYPSGEVTWSPEMYEQLGLPLEEPASLQRLFELIHPDDRARVRSVEHDALDRSSATSVELRVIRPDGKLRHLFVHAKPVFEPDGTLARYVGANVDVTELRKLEAELRQSQKLEAIGQLAAGVAHDFNNLLMIVFANAELLRDDSNAAPLADEILDACGRARDLTRQLLAVGRRSTMQVQSVDLGRALQEAARLLKRVLGERIELIVDPESTPIVVAADPSLVTQVLLNLVVNARDAMPNGGTLTISTDRVHLSDVEVDRWIGVRPGPYARLQVTDTGSGMPEAVRARVFEPFFTTKPVGAGTGLGLSTAFGIVAQWNGAMDVTSCEGRGSTFSVYLPEQPPMGAQAIPQETVELRVERRRIAVIEDDASVRAIIMRTMRRTAFDAVAFESADAFLAALELGRAPELIISDVVMPGTTGTELCQVLEDLGLTTPVLLITGYAPDQAGLERASAVLSKPFTRAELLDRIHAVLNT